MIFHNLFLKKINQFDSWRFKSLILIAIGIIFKWISYFINYSVYANNRPHLYNNFLGDDRVYMEYCENFFNYGTYFIKLGEIVDYTFRMPAFNLIYYPLRLFLSKDLTMDGIVILQVTIAGICSYFLAKISFFLFSSKKIFYLTFFISLFGFLNTFYISILFREGFAYSSIIFGVYFYLKGLSSKKKIDFLISGFFITWLIFLRPYSGVLFVLMSSILLYFFYFKKRITLGSFIFFNSFFVIFISLWTIRNYKLTDRFIPLETSSGWMNESEALNAKVRFIKSFGFHWEDWVEGSQGGWLTYTNVKLDKNTINSIFPKRTFNGDLNPDSLVKLKYHYNLFLRSGYVENREFHGEKATRLFDKFIIELKKNRILDYYFLNRLRVLKSFLNNNTSKDLKNIKYPFNVILFFFETYFNLIIKILGFISLILLVKKFYKNLLILSLIVFFPVFIVSFFCLYGGSDESRFYFLCVPFLIISSSYLVMRFWSKSTFFKIILCILFLIPLFPSYSKVVELIKF